MYPIETSSREALGGTAVIWYKRKKVAKSVVELKALEASFKSVKVVNLRKTK